MVFFAVAESPDIGDSASEERITCQFSYTNKTTFWDENGRILCGEILPRRNAKNRNNKLIN